ncbi:MAG: type II toxin-antitoxin system RelE/ParE family toxin [Cyanobacteria bacterium P01_F01_bin.42]
MNRRIILRPRANRDIDNHVDYLAQNNDDTALEFFDAVRSTVAQLARMPGMGSLYSIKNPRLKGLRRWSVKGFKRYIIFYLEQDDTIEVVRILHASRDLGNIFNREQ